MTLRLPRQKPMHLCSFGWSSWYPTHAISTSVHLVYFQQTNHLFGSFHEFRCYFFHIGPFNTCGLIRSLAFHMRWCTTSEENYLLNWSKTNEFFIELRSPATCTFSHVIIIKVHKIYVLLFRQNSKKFSRAYILWLPLNDCCCCCCSLKSLLVAPWKPR